ncbi:MAG: CPBP family intramembrane glutamic endopeptidase, partial [Lacticaseibacillus paracasei]
MVDNRTLLKEIIAVSLTAIGWGILPSLAVGMLLGLLSMNTATLLDTRFIILIGFVAQFL